MNDRQKVERMLLHDRCQFQVANSDIFAWCVELCSVAHYEPRRRIRTNVTRTVGKPSILFALVLTEDTTSSYTRATTCRGNANPRTLEILELNTSAPFHGKHNPCLVSWNTNTSRPAYLHATRNSLSSICHSFTALLTARRPSLSSRSRICDDVLAYQDLPMNPEVAADHGKYRSGRRRDVLLNRESARSPHVSPWGVAKVWRYGEVWRRLSGHSIGKASIKSRRNSR